MNYDQATAIIYGQDARTGPGTVVPGGGGEAFGRTGV